VAFKGRDPVRTETGLDNKTVEQVNSFNYLGNMISYEKELDINNKLHDYLKITVILSNVFRPQKIPYENKNKMKQYTNPPSFVMWQRNLGYESKGRQKNNSSRD